MATIETRYDRERGCGWRKSGGLYLVSNGTMVACGRMPLPLSTCGCCGAGVKPARAWTWVEMPTLLAQEAPRHCAQPWCGACALNPTRAVERMGLLWCGEAFYKTPQDWIREAQTQGISRRIAAMPIGLVLGETWILMAHRKAISGVTDQGEIVYHPGIIQAFRPTAAEYVVTGEETEEEFERMVKRGITPIRVERAQEQQSLV